MQDSMLQAGTEPGLRFACVINGRRLRRAPLGRRRSVAPGRWFPLDPSGAGHARGDRLDPRGSGLDPLVAQALLDDQIPAHHRVVRPRPLLLVLRGVNIAEKDEGRAGADARLDRSAPGHLRCATDHSLTALRDIRIALKTGRGPRKPGSLLVQMCEKIVRDVARASRRWTTRWRSWRMP